jgi:hypothetical protein
MLAAFLALNVSNDTLLTILAVLGIVLVCVVLVLMVTGRWRG